MELENLWVRLKKHEMPETDAFDRIVSRAFNKQFETKTQQKPKEMNENLNLLEKLKNVPAGTKFYTTTRGDCDFCRIDGEYVIVKISNYSNAYIYELDKFGRIGEDGECILFPSKDQRDWSKFEIPLKDKELVWAWDNCSQFCRYLVFYDTKFKRSYNLTDGGRSENAYTFDNYERFKGEWPEWAKDAVKKLED